MPRPLRAQASGAAQARRGRRRLAGGAPGGVAERSAREPAAPEAPRPRPPPRCGAPSEARSCINCHEMSCISSARISRIGAGWPLKLRRAELVRGGAEERRRGDCSTSTNDLDVRLPDTSCSTVALSNM
ncbi:unnamed protein product [Prorocentrum cordatum]|uniref:Uncharacterized protein n=1 Tax=Prorocentrum cordatum TaxID=2364126 RepID=A0ABN9XNT3_9DINO|nr:unnamed protein product [Polarella glacialis]